LTWGQRIDPAITNVECKRGGCPKQQDSEKLPQPKPHPGASDFAEGDHFEPIDIYSTSLIQLG
jgi:hypothetical protein